MICSPVWNVGLARLKCDALNPPSMSSSTRRTRPDLTPSPCSGRNSLRYELIHPCNNDRRFSVKADLHLWQPQDKVVVVDIDGTVTVRLLSPSSRQPRAGLTPACAENGCCGIWSGQAGVRVHPRGSVRVCDRDFAPRLPNTLLNIAGHHARAEHEVDVPSCRPVARRLCSPGVMRAHRRPAKGAMRRYTHRRVDDDLYPNF